MSWATNPSSSLDYADNGFQLMMTGDTRNTEALQAQNFFVLPALQPPGQQQKGASKWQIGFQEDIDLKAPGIREAKPGRSNAITYGWAHRTDVFDPGRTVQTPPNLNWDQFEWLYKSDWMARRGAYMRQHLIDSDLGNRAINKDTGVFTPAPYPFTALRYCTPKSTTTLL